MNHRIAPVPGLALTHRIISDERSRCDDEGKDRKLILPLLIGYGDVVRGYRRKSVRDPAREFPSVSEEVALEVVVPERHAAMMLRTSFMERALSAEFVGLTA